MGFSLKVRKFSKADIAKRVHDASVILGIEDLLDRRPKALSGGQRQRVAMGRAIVREPQAFLMDEPLSNLDAKLRVQMRAEIRRIQTRLGVTTIFVTHDQTEAMTMGDRVAVMKKGHLQQVDTPQVLYERPANLFVGGFIGSPAMNMVEATLARQDDRLVVRFGSSWLGIDPAMAAGLERFEGRRLVLGIRPETIQHERYAGLEPEGRRLSAKIDLLESLGSEILAHFDVDAPPVLTEDTRELARDREETDKLEGLVEERVCTFIAKIDPRAQVRLGDTVPLVVDTSRLHLFDPDDGSRIG
jgi:multiple sugar transport system ATP-binding protein